MIINNNKKEQGVIAVGHTYSAIVVCLFVCLFVLCRFVLCGVCCLLFVFCFLLLVGAVALVVLLFPFCILSVCVRMEISTVNKSG